MSTVAEKKEPAKEMVGFRPVPMVAFQPMDSLGVNLYCMREGDTKPVLLASGHLTKTREQLVAICVDDCECLLISDQDFSRFSQKLLGVLDQLLANDSISVETRFALLQIAYADEIECSFRKSSIENYIALAQELGPKISALLQQGKVSVHELFQQVDHSSSHSTHVTNVAAYAVILASRLKTATPEELDRIATGCLLHEVGKLYVSKTLLNKKGRLTPHDHEELNSAPQLAYEILSDYSTIDFAQLMMAYQHCERVDGTGYPVRILAEEIHPWAKLLALVDAFDAMTSDRSFRSAATVREALVQLVDNGNTHFDPEIVLCWISAFQQR